jgi:hypothetical protein
MKEHKRAEDWLMRHGRAGPCAGLPATLQEGRGVEQQPKKILRADATGPIRSLRLVHRGPSVAIIEGVLDHDEDAVYSTYRGPHWFGVVLTDARVTVERPDERDWQLVASVVERVLYICLWVAGPQVQLWPGEG